MNGLWDILEEHRIEYETAVHLVYELSCIVEGIDFNKVVRQLDEIVDSDE